MDSNPRRATSGRQVPGSASQKAPVLPPLERSGAMRYGVAVLLVGAALALSVALRPYLAPSIFLALYPVAALAAWYGGLGPGIVASVMAVLGANLWLLPPFGRISFDANNLLRLAAFLATSILVSWIATAERAAPRRASERAAQSAALARQLQEQAIELEQQLEESQQLQEELEEHQNLLQEAQQLQGAEERRLRFLGNASRTLASALDYQATLRAVARAFVPDLSDWCAVDMLLEPGSGAWPPPFERLAVAHQDPEKVAWAMELSHRLALDWSVDRGFARVIRTGQPEYFPLITDEMLVASARSEEQLALLREIGFTGYICVPIKRGDVVLGAITLAMSDSGRNYAESDLRLAEDVAGRAAVAIRHAELYREAEQSRAEAEEANRAKTEFLAVMSHELRTPLNAIGGYAQLMELGIHGVITPQQRDDLQRIQRSARHLLSLINQILNFAKLDAGQVPLELQRVPLGDALADLEALVGPQLSAKGVTFERTAPESEVALWCDPEKLQQILLNLLSNAIKFTPEGGTVALRAELQGAFGSIVVEDTGPGIPADKIERIFEPFVQLERGLASPQQGAGLGLAISRELARAMGGDLRAENAGTGARFRLTLPLARGAGARARA